MKARSLAAWVLCFLLLSGAAATAVEIESVSVSAMTAENCAPVARSLNLTTYRGVSVGGVFQAVDPEGDLLSYRVTVAPGKGSVTVEGDRFVYTPQAGRRGRDRFCYQAVDSAGNASAEAGVSIRLEKSSTAVFYPELAGCGCQYAATRMAEEGIFTGEKVGNCYCFSPAAELTRGDFLTMCAALTGMTPLEDVTKTGFSDDESILPWQKPYVSAALLYGVVRGSTEPGGRVVFRGDQPITGAEAAVMLNSFLEITDTSSVFSGGDVPEWAAQAVSNLYACDVFSGDFLADRLLSRQEAAEMLSAALDVLEARGKHSRFSWEA